MTDTFKILIADRNRHVREFLRRELIAEGFQVQVAGEGLEVLKMVNVEEPPDLVILDLELPNSGGLTMIERLQRQAPRIPVVIHTFLTEYATDPVVVGAAAFVEKRADTDRLKGTVVEVLRRRYPERYEGGDGGARVQEVDDTTQIG